VRGHSASGIGVHGTSASDLGVDGYSSTGTGVYGGTGNASGNWAGFFSGNVNVTGTCCGAGAGTYRIDHPLDPENKYLYHSAVESPDMKTVYDGNSTLDSKGEAWVEMPAWFEALNRDLRYQLTAVGAPAPNLYIAEKLAGNRFKIAGGAPGMEVSWQVTGIRKDLYAEKHRIPVEEVKPEQEKGLYLHPELYGQPESKRVDGKSRP
jgi:hypothetical protein